MKWREGSPVMKTKNILLTLSLAAFAIGFSDLHENMIFWSGRPVGAILFVLYMIFLVLEEPSALFDQQEKEKLARINGAKNSAQSEKQDREASAPALTMAPSR